jgi:hypothetical protein
MVHSNKLDFTSNNLWFLVIFRISDTQKHEKQQYLAKKYNIS